MYRKSVIKRSIKEHISIIDIEQMTPKLADSADAPMTRQDEAKFQLEADENQTSHFVYLSNDYLINSSDVQFMGKLKVKWRKKYENIADIADMSRANLNGCGTKEINEPAVDCSLNKFRKESPRQTPRFENTADVEDRISDSDKAADNQCEDVPVVRKLERARKGLIYQKFMASTYSWNKKEKSRCVSSKILY